MKNLTEIALQMEPLYINWVGAVILVAIVVWAVWFLPRIYPRFWED